MTKQRYKIHEHDLWPLQIQGVGIIEINFVLPSKLHDKIETQFVN